MQITDDDIAEYDAMVEQFALSFTLSDSSIVRGILDETGKGAEDRFGADFYNNVRISGRTAQLWLKSTSSLQDGAILVCTDDNVRWQVKQPPQQFRFPKKIGEVVLICVSPMNR